MSLVKVAARGDTIIRQVARQFNPQEMLKPEVRRWKAAIENLKTNTIMKRNLNLTKEVMDYESKGMRLGTSQMLNRNLEQTMKNVETKSTERTERMMEMAKRILNG